MTGTNAIATTLVTITKIDMDASEVQAVLESQPSDRRYSLGTEMMAHDVKAWLDSQDDPQGDRRYTITIGESSFEIDCYGIVRDTGRYYGNHWIACWLYDLSMDHSYPDDIVYGEGDIQYSVFSLEYWQTEALGDDITAIAVYQDDSGFVGYSYMEGKSADELAEAIAPTCEDEYEDDDDDCDSECDS